jgi:hypothetical protein
VARIATLTAGRDQPLSRVACWVRLPQPGKHHRRCGSCCKKKMWQGAGTVNLLANSKI